MLQLHVGKSYLWLFPIFGLLFGVGFALVGEWGILTMPAFIAFLLFCELRSGVALDSLWRASHPQGTWQFRALVAWHFVGVILFLIFAYLFVGFSLIA